MMKLRCDQGTKEEKELMQHITETVEKHMTLEQLDDLNEDYC
jgi:hypothetical protein